MNQNFPTFKAHLGLGMFKIEGYELDKYTKTNQ